MSRDKVLQECLTEMFRRVGETYPNETLTKNPDWYRMRAWLQEEENDFRKWMVDFLRKKMRLRKKEAEKEVAWFLLYYGWKTPGKDGCLTLVGKEKRK